MQGKLITIEGGEGVGKSTQIGRLRDFAAEQGVEVVVTREPGGTHRAERIRELLLEINAEPMPSTCELLLMFAARSTHIENVIGPALARGACVICDRFTDATYAYQGGGRSLPIENIATLEQMVQGTLRPDLTLLLDAPLDISAARASARNAAAGTNDRFEQERREFFERVRTAYLDRARQAPKRFAVIDATQSLEAVTVSIQRVITERLMKLSPPRS